MKATFIIVCAALLCSLNATARQDKNVPAAVKTAFLKDHAGAAKVKWEQENGQYEASFTEHGTAMSILYTASGAVTETETGIPVRALPKAARDMAAAKGKIKEAARIVKNNGEVLYEAEVNGKDLLFDEKGTPVQ